jgi:hypothetical protein
MADVLLPIALLVVLAVMCAAGIVMWVRLAARNDRIIEAPEGRLEMLFRGGVMARHIITSGTLVRLEFLDWGIRLRGSMISRWVVPTWEARYDELAVAKLVALPMSRIAVWFRLRGEPGGIAFLSESSKLILAELARHGVAVDRSLIRINRVEEMYQ